MNDTKLLMQHKQAINRTKLGTSSLKNIHLAFQMLLNFQNVCNFDLRTKHSLLNVLHEV